MAEDTINQLAYNLASLSEWAKGGSAHRKPRGSLMGFSMAQDYCATTTRPVAWSARVGSRHPKPAPEGG
jgi:hypothetical protein